MTTPGKDLLLREWRAANNKAHGMEQALARSCVAALDGKAPWPTEDERARVKAARSLADDLFQVSMAEINERARFNKPK